MTFAWQRFLTVSPVLCILAVTWVRDSYECFPFFLKEILARDLIKLIKKLLSFRKAPFKEKRGFKSKGSLTWKRFRGVSDFSIKGGRNTFAEQQCDDFLDSELTLMCCANLGSANKINSNQRMLV